jgi:hypothetical protein
LAEDGFERMEMGACGTELAPVGFNLGRQQDGFTLEQHPVLSSQARGALISDTAETLRE